MGQKVANFLRLFWGCVFLGGSLLNLVLTIVAPDDYAGTVNLAWPPALQSLWDSTIAPNIIIFLTIFVIIEIILGLLLVNKGKPVKYGLLGALLFGVVLLLLGPGAPEGQAIQARIPNFIFEAMIVYCMFFSYDKTLIETLKRKKTPVQTNVIGG
jgi:hypothetical protein